MNDASKWYEFSVYLPIEAVDDVSSQLSGSFYGGSMALELPADLSEESGSRSPAGTAVLRGYICPGAGAEDQMEAVERALWHLQQTGVPITYSVRSIAPEEWLTGWRSFFRPVRVGRVCVVPGWESSEDVEAPIKIAIEPGMAFGTGLHPTTQLCLLLLQEVPVAGARCLDLGTGTGILAIAVARLGASRVLALDIDPVAVDAARENVAHNGTEALVEVREGTLPVAEAFDLALANLSSSYFIESAHLLRGALRDGGIVIASGVVEERLDVVLVALAAAGFQPNRVERRNGWVAVLARAGEGPP